MLTGFPLKQGADEWMLATTVATQRRMHTSGLCTGAGFPDIMHRDLRTQWC